MGNAISPCLIPASKDSVKLVFWGGSTRFLAGTQPAGELMFEFPDQIVCHADSFYIGHPFPALGIDDELNAGETYFVLPTTDCFPCHVISAASLSSLSAAAADGGPKRSPINFGQCPFEYVKSADGGTLIKVVPEFITRIISGDRRRDSISCSSSVDGGGGSGSLCNTPELRKHYAQLVVGRREQPWSPKLETISECKRWLSLSRLLGSDRR